MVDLAQAFRQVKSLPDEALQNELSKPTGLLPGFLVLGEMRERKTLRDTTSVPPTKAKTLVSDYVGQGMQPYMPERQPSQGIASLPNNPPTAFAGGGIVSTGGRFRGQNVDPRLLQYLEQAANGFPYKVEFMSGFREGDPRQHGKGNAVDVQLYDPSTGKALANYQDASTFTPYQQFANRFYQTAAAADPRFANNARWGGYFSGGKGKYGAMDVMHFDTAGHVGMAGGSWQGGLNPEQAKRWGLPTGGGITSVVAAGPPGYTMDQRRGAIRSIESAGSGGYRALGPQTASGDRAYGAYQVMGNNIRPWTKQALGKEMTKEEFLASDAAQDAVFDKIFGGYVDKYGDKGAASMWFTGRPAAMDAKDILGTTGRSYVDKYMNALGQPVSPVTTATPVAAVNQAPAVTPTAATPEVEADGLGGLGDFLALAQMFAPKPQAPPPMAGPAKKAQPIDPQALTEQFSQTPGVYEDERRRRQAYG